MNDRVFDKLLMLRKASPQNSTVRFRIHGIDSSMKIEDFLEEYGYRRCGDNFEIYEANDTLSSDSYIKYLY